MNNKALEEQYKLKLRTADEAIRMIGSGQRVFVGSSCGEPQHLVNALMDNANHFLDVEIVRLLSLESSLLALMAKDCCRFILHLFRFLRPMIMAG